MAAAPPFRAGYVALVGRPNVGKSTLLNAVVGHKVSIVSNKPQTTRRRIVGVAHGRREDGTNYQIAFIDTPGIHEPHNRLGRAMVEQARAALGEADMVLAVVDSAEKPGEGDARIGEMVRAAGLPTLLCLNKMDLLKAEFVQGNTEEYLAMFAASESMLTTATRGFNLDRLVELIVARLPERPPIFADDEFTDGSARFLTAELVREKILVATRQEVPHATAVHVDGWEEEPTRDGKGKIHIRATIVVEKASQRAILIGKGGRSIKDIGVQARPEIETLVGKPIFLELFVKVEEGWRQNPRLLHELDYS